MKSLIALSLCILSIISCHQDMKPNKEQIELWKQEVLETEHRFSEMAQSEGMNKAFLYFASDDAILLRNEKLIKGKSAIAEYMVDSNSKGLKWSPDFVDVASSGDLAYTYGTYSYTHQDTTGKDIITKGIFHTVWRRQSNGSWKFVWD
ncbi:YybH family protein [Aestuariibaculum lutulentum]|uniref:Nuclear transport factor 2 family protein n=1 Tax=Aestuariibaculum lutulentum TaxID=2920935 RepID=A0ABS9RIZ4_9FLAO|nr:nuclear transport factor 2 family protein [Aestuariibaculum lutulentum]MCH4552923.1 nuclear transport factor 2 family protein [Aestuariibaculum lutulentum]